MTPVNCRQKNKPKNPVIKNLPRKPFFRAFYAKRVLSTKIDGKKLIHIFEKLSPVQKRLFEKILMIVNFNRETKIGRQERKIR